MIPSYVRCWHRDAKKAAEADDERAKRERLRSGAAGLRMGTLTRRMECRGYNQVYSRQSFGLDGMVIRTRHFLIVYVLTRYEAIYSYFSHSIMRHFMRVDLSGVLAGYTHCIRLGNQDTLHWYFFIFSSRAQTQRNSFRERKQHVSSGYGYGWPDARKTSFQMPFGIVPAFRFTSSPRVISVNIQEEGYRT